VENHLLLVCGNPVGIPDSCGLIIIDFESKIHQSLMKNTHVYNADIMGKLVVMGKMGLGFYVFFLLKYTKA